MTAPTVLILAAGMGTRMCSRTPKVLHEICGLPMLLWPIRAARAAGAGRVVVVDSPELALREVLPEGVEIAVQPQPDGTGGAVRAGVAALEDRGGVPDEPILVLSGDVPLVSAQTIAGLVAAHRESAAAATVASTTLEDPSGYGRIVRAGDGGLERVVETKEAGDATPAQLELREVNTGVYVFAPEALREALPRLTAENAQRELYLPQALELIRAARGRVAVHEVSDAGLVLGVNDRAGLARVRELAQAAIHARHMAVGVTIVDPAATVIDLDVKIGPDTIVEPFTTIRGASVIGEGCLIRHSYLVDCLLEDNVTVGPFAYLRPGTVLRASAKVGTFVEIKNSDIGTAAKVPHLSYIGDAQVGEHTNLGASTITANYDGRAKHPTAIGPHVHTSVHTSLVAPVTLAEHSYTAAGSVITEDVPAQALAIARPRQRNIEGYASRQPSDARDG
ncbi:MAG TPA: bifunctional UDP-N-acetylglucosamine diphosphorylase/glucosamine-1-phosphate N-acetyltransferase GlmU [Solirubrobacteraceae bacterium]|nr:bifunctional UDP-N-acetylglucosamine diphosphorylase/glucosamine-1-phosphate N-acetyltransferase GlmU [Solirubrobacteraceae bacterium]